MGEQAVNIHKLDWANFFRKESNDDDKNAFDFMYVVTLDDDDKQEADGASWEGSIKQMNKMTQHYMD